MLVIAEPGLVMTQMLRPGTSCGLMGTPLGAAVDPTGELHVIYSMHGTESRTVTAVIASQTIPAPSEVIASLFVRGVPVLVVAEWPATEDDHQPDDAEAGADGIASAEAVGTPEVTQPDDRPGSTQQQQ